VPSGGTVGLAFFCTFQRAQKHSNLTFCTFYSMYRAASEKSSRARTDNIINSVPKLYSLDLGTFRVALLFCSSPKVLATCDSDSRVTLATPYGNPECLPLQGPVQLNELGLRARGSPCVRWNSPCNSFPHAIAHSHAYVYMFHFTAAAYRSVPVRVDLSCLRVRHDVQPSPSAAKQLQVAL
jgi:hypothetical protein